MGVGTRGRPAKRLWKEEPLQPLKEIAARVTLSERLEAEHGAELPTHKCGCERERSQIFCRKHGKY